MPNTPNMGLTLPTPTVTLGPTYANQNNAAFTGVDSHDHTSGKGLQVPSLGIGINADLTFAGFNATNLKSTRFTSQGSALIGASDLSCLYVVSGNLYYNNSSGVAIQVTAGTGVNFVGSAGINGNYASSGASVFYTLGSQLYSFTNSGGTFSNLKALTYAAVNAGGFAATLSVPAALAANYSIVLPSAAPAANQVLIQNSGNTGLAWSTRLAPTIQKFTATGTTTGYLFTVTAANATAGATYTNNGNTYTVLGTITAGTQLYCSQASAPLSSGTLTKASGTGDATIAFSVYQTLATYTTAANALYLRVRMAGGGGGGAAAATNNGTAGLQSVFGTSLLVCGPGTGGNISTSPGTGGAATITGLTGIALAGQNGTQGAGASATNCIGSPGGNNPIFGGGGVAGASGGAATTNSGGGGGAGFSGGTSGGGGGAGGGIDVIIPSPSATYVYAVGTGGLGGTAGTNAGGAGAAGQIVVEECYQ